MSELHIRKTYTVRKNYLISNTIELEAWLPHHNKNVKKILRNVLCVKQFAGRAKTFYTSINWGCFQWPA
jgi:hypothetical protein